MFAEICNSGGHLGFISVWIKFQTGIQIPGANSIPQIDVHQYWTVLATPEESHVDISRRSCLDVQVSGMVLEYPNYKRKTHRNEVKSTNFHPLWESLSYNLLEQPMVSCLFILQGFQTWPKACGIINQSNLRQVDDRICPNVSRTKENKLAFQICGCSMLEPA